MTRVTPHVYILTCCRSPALLYASTLVFESLRIGFPTADITVFDNASEPGMRPAIHKAALAAGCDFAQLENEVPHAEHVRRVLREHAAGSIVLLDPDVIFWQCVESWSFDRLLTGKLNPQAFFYLDGARAAIEVPRLHTSFLWIADVQLLRAKMADLCATRPELDLIRSQYAVVEGDTYFVDTGAVVCNLLPRDVRAFNAAELDAFTHLVAGTYVDKLNPNALAVHAAHAAAAAGNLEALRGLWRTYEGCIHRTRSKLLPRTFGVHDVPDYWQAVLSAQAPPLAYLDLASPSSAFPEVVLDRLRSTCETFANTSEKRLDATEIHLADWEHPPRVNCRFLRP